jgi:hypothetical protein
MLLYYSINSSQTILKTKRYHVPSNVKLMYAIFEDTEL